MYGDASPIRRIRCHDGRNRLLSQSAVDKFSAADVYIGSEIRFAMMFGASGLKGEKVFDDHVARLSARPAAQRTAGG